MVAASRRGRCQSSAPRPVDVLNVDQSRSAAEQGGEGDAGRDKSPQVGVFR